MTKKEFDNTKWRKGMRVTVIGEPWTGYEVAEADFGKNTAGFFTDEDYLRLRHDEVELVRE